VRGQIGVATLQLCATNPPLSQRERGDKRLPRPLGEGWGGPSPKGRGETRDSLALWERAGVRVTNLDILSIGEGWMV